MVQMFKSPSGKLCQVADHHGQPRSRPGPPGGLVFEEINYCRMQHPKYHLNVNSPYFGRKCRFILSGSSELIPKLYHRSNHQFWGLQTQRSDGVIHRSYIPWKTWCKNMPELFRYGARSYPPIRAVKVLKIWLVESQIRPIDQPKYDEQLYITLLSEFAILRFPYYCLQIYQNMLDKTL